ncbi:prepilin-type N-terminal cleavage/methylation domain-containing protein [Candidatus Uhrbacteria bacterium]|nr:prepilin-type N-terminal cleavage/methylation domain-containing protein [Candidatus Uhrbacteria bacterium]
MSQTKNGFTLLESLLVIATITALAGIALPIYQSFHVRNDLDIAAVTIAQGIRRAQALAQASDGDTSWGVRAQSGSITLFKGASYAARDVSFDELFDLQNSITADGTTEIIFTKFSGHPQTTGTLTLISNTNETRTLTINAKGMVAY